MSLDELMKTPVAFFFALPTQAIPRGELLGGRRKQVDRVPQTIQGLDPFAKTQRPVSIDRSPPPFAFGRKRNGNLQHDVPSHSFVW